MAVRSLLVATVVACALAACRPPSVLVERGVGAASAPMTAPAIGADSLGYARVIDTAAPRAPIPAQASADVDTRADRVLRVVITALLIGAIVFIGFKALVD